MAYDSVELKEPAFAVIEDDVIKKLVFKKNDGELLEVGVGVDSIPDGTYVGTTGAQTIAGRKKFLGADRGDGTFYLAEIGGNFPSIAVNTAITINGATGDPVPFGIAGENTYMFGVSSDVAAAPAVVWKGQTGPILRVYTAADTLAMEIVTAGQIKMRGGLASTPAYSFIDDTGTGVDRPSANILTFYAGGSERGRFTTARFSTTDGVGFTAGGDTLLKNYAVMNAAQGNAFIDWISTSTLGNPSAGYGRLAMRTVGGKVQFYAIFPTGAAIPIATEV